MKTRFAPHREAGAGMIETLVGITIGLLVILVIYNMLAVAEGYKRMTTGYADAQVTGLLSNFVTSLDAANGGNGLYSAYPNLVNCNLDEGSNPYTDETSLKPIPVMITRGATWNDSDSFISRQSASPHVVWAVPMRPTDGLPSEVIAPGGPLRIQSPLGFMDAAKASLPTLANPHWAVTMANDGTGRCGLVKIINAAPTPLMDVTGNVVLTQGAPATGMSYNTFSQGAANTPAMLLNLGRVGDTSRIRYDVVGGQLRTTDCMEVLGCAGQVPRPIAQNVVLMKVQFGIDQSALNANGTHDATIDCWTSDDLNGATDCPVALPAVPPGLPDPVNILNWDPATLLKIGDPLFKADVPASALNRIVAVRIGIVVRSDEPDFRDPALFVSPAVTLDNAAGTRPATGAANATYLFNCAANDNTCQGRVQVSAGAAATDTMQNGFRYRVYEAVIPLRNAIFNATLPP